MKMLNVLIAGLGLLALASCEKPNTTPPTQTQCINTAVHKQKYLNAADITSHYSVLAGGIREYRYREPVTGICTDFHVLIFAVIEVVDSVDAQITQDAIATADSGALSLTFPMPASGTALDPGYTRYMGDSGSGFLISSVYPSPAEGEITAGINIRFPTLGTEAEDSIFFFSHVKNMVLSIGYYQ